MTRRGRHVPPAAVPRTLRSGERQHTMTRRGRHVPPAAVDHELSYLTTELIALCRRHPAFRRRHTGKAASDLRWFTLSGAEMTAKDWSNPNARSMGLFIDGSTDPDHRPHGMPMTISRPRQRLVAGVDLRRAGRSTQQPLGRCVRGFRPNAETLCRGRTYAGAALGRGAALRESPAREPMITDVRCCSRTLHRIGDVV